jgi:hypothetical protein
MFAMSCDASASRLSAARSCPDEYGMTATSDRGIDRDRGGSASNGDRRRATAVLCVVDGDDLRSIRAAPAIASLRARGQRRVRDQQPCVRVAQLNATSSFVYAGLIRRQDRAQADDGVKHHGVLGRVRRPDRDDITFADRRDNPAATRRT